jgi:DNA-binding CsgD family transcriptional regulator
MHRERAQRVKREIERLCHCGLAPLVLLRQAKGLLREVVPFDASCWLLIDPASLLVTGGSFDYPRELQPALARNEFLEDDVNKLVSLSRQIVPVGSLSHITDGHPERSTRYREILWPAGLAPELRATFRAEFSTWGACALYRMRDAPDFEPDEAAFVGSLSGLLGVGLRRSLIAGTVATSAVAGNEPGLITLADDGSIEAISPEAERWLDDLRDCDLPEERAVLPPALLPVASRVRAVAAGASSSDIGPASARILTRSGRWLHVHATLLKGQRPLRAALILEAVRPAELAPLIVEAYGFSHRERQVTELVLQGASTAEMASRLNLSPLTVQDHLKAIFEKMSVRSRREVASRIFFDHHFPPTLQMDPSGLWQFAANPAEPRVGRRASG